MKKLLVVLMVVSVFATGCSLFQDEKDRFVDATIEATCLIFQADNIFDPSLEGQAKEIYEKHGFDSDDEEAMLALTEKYQSDPDVEAAITAGLEECAGDILGGLTDAMEGAMDVEADLMEEELIDEEEAVMEEEEVSEPDEEAPIEEEVKTEEPAIVCTDEMKTCADGSDAGRVPGSCEFNPCPEELTE